MLASISRNLARPAVADWLIKQASLRPYSHVKGEDGTTYMERYWLFNPYPTNEAERRWWKSKLPSIRIHRILREDQQPHLHDHPWNVRTFILWGWYREEREADCSTLCKTHFYFRTRGQTASQRYGEYHRITAVAPGGVWTLFVTWKKQGTWGFKVDGKKVPWREYLGLNKGESNE